MPTLNSDAPNIPGSTSASRAKQKASEMGRKVADSIDESRPPVAEKLDSAAASLHEKAESLPGGEKVASAAHTAADAMGSAAGYLRDNDLKSMLADVQQLVKRNPGPALLTAAALGFLMARTFSRD